MGDVSDCECSTNNHYSHLVSLSVSLSLSQYVYEAPPVLAQNGLVNPRVVQPGVVASPVSTHAHTPYMYGHSMYMYMYSLYLQYVQTPAHHMSGYQVHTTVCTCAWVYACV